MPIRILILNGPNLNLLGKREREIYGSISFEDHLIKLKAKFPHVDLGYYQSNHEGALIDKMQEVGYDFQGIILNAAGYTHTSIAIMDTINAIETPVVEVHISDISKREVFRRHSYVSLAAVHAISGRGLDGYDMGIEWLLKHGIK